MQTVSVLDEMILTATGEPFGIRLYSYVFKFNVSHENFLPRFWELRANEFTKLLWNFICVGPCNVLITEELTTEIDRNTLSNTTERQRTSHRTYTTYLLTYLLTYVRKYLLTYLFHGAEFAASQEIPRISRNPKVHYRTHKRPPPVSILGQPNPVHIPTSHLLEIKLNITHPFTPRSPRWSPSLTH